MSTFTPFNAPAAVGADSVAAVTQLANEYSGLVAELKSHETNTVSQNNDIHGVVKYVDDKVSSLNAATIGSTGFSRPLFVVKSIEESKGKITGTTIGVTTSSSSESSPTLATAGYVEELHTKVNSVAETASTTATEAKEAISAHSSFNVSMNSAVDVHNIIGYVTDKVATLQANKVGGSSSSGALSIVNSIKQTNGIIEAESLEVDTFGLTAGSNHLATSGVILSALNSKVNEIYNKEFNGTTASFTGDVSAKDVITDNVKDTSGNTILEVKDNGVNGKDLYFAKDSSTGTVGYANVIFGSAPKVVVKDSSDKDIYTNLATAKDIYNMFPIGGIIRWPAVASDNLPEGWLKCDGSLVPTKMVNGVDVYATLKLLLKGSALPVEDHSIIKAYMTADTSSKLTYTEATSLASLQEQIDTERSIRLSSDSNYLLVFEQDFPTSCTYSAYSQSCVAESNGTGYVVAAGQKAYAKSVSEGSTYTAGVIYKATINTSNATPSDGDVFDIVWESTGQKVTEV